MITRLNWSDTRDIDSLSTMRSMAKSVISIRSSSGSDRNGLLLRFEHEEEEEHGGKQDGAIKKRAKRNTSFDYIILLRLSLYA